MASSLGTRAEMASSLGTRSELASSLGTRTALASSYGNRAVPSSSLGSSYGTRPEPASFATRADMRFQRGSSCSTSSPTMEALLESELQDQRKVDSSNSGGWKTEENQFQIDSGHWRSRARTSRMNGSGWHQEEARGEGWQSSMSRSTQGQEHSSSWKPEY